MKTISQIREASGGKEAYQKFFNSLLKKFGVSSPSELKGDKKKEFFDAIDKGWDGDNEKAESVKEASKLKAGRGKITVDLNYDASDADTKASEKKYKIKLKITRTGALATGEKKNVLAYIQSDDYGMDDEDIEDLMPEILETYDDEDDLDPETTANADENPLATGKSLGEANSAQLKKAQAIASKNSGDMEAAIAEIEKIKKGLSNDKKVMAMLKTANETYEVGTDKYKKHAKKVTPGEKESVDEANRFSKKLNKPSKHIYDLALNAIRRNNVRGKKDQDAYVDDVAGVSLTNKELELVKQAIQHESVTEGVSVDRRTLGFKEAMKRRAEAKAKREAAKIKAAKVQSKKDIANIDANYAYDGDIEEILTSANKKIMGQHEDAAANASSSGAVDMNPTGKSKKKEKENLMAKYGY